MKRRSFFKELSRQTLSAYQLDKTQHSVDDTAYEVMSANTDSSSYIVTDLNKCFELQDLKQLANVIFSEDLSINFQELNKDNYLYFSSKLHKETAPLMLWQPEEIELDKIKESTAPTLILLHWFADQTILEKVQKLSLEKENVDIFVGNLKEKLNEQSPAFMRIQSFIQDTTA